MSYRPDRLISCILSFIIIIIILGSSCKSLSNPFNGYVKLYDNNSPGTKAQYYCDEDYTLSGNRQRFCQKTCAWSGQDPICKSKLIYNYN